LISFPQSGLSHDVSEGAPRNFVGHTAWYRNATWLQTMMILPMTTPLPAQKPSVVFRQFDDFSNIHCLATVATIDQFRVAINN